MHFPIYIFYELTIRLSENRPDIGAFQKAIPKTETHQIQFENGYLEISNEILRRQFTDPTSITKTELISLANQFNLKKI